MFNQGDKISELLDYIPDIRDHRIQEVTLLRLVKFSPRDVHNKCLIAFTLHCDPHFEINSYAKRCEDSKMNCKRFSVIKYSSITYPGVCFGQVIGIVKCNGNISILVSRLVEELPQATHRKLPYPLFKYGMQPHDNTRFAEDFVPIANVLSPCFVIPAVDQKNNAFVDYGKHHRLKEEMSYFYVLTPDRCGLTEIFEYSDYVTHNLTKNPWNPKCGNKTCLNYNFYLDDS